MPWEFTDNKDPRSIASRKKFNHDYDTRTITGREIKLIWTPKQPPLPPWAELPDDITVNILNRLGAVEILESAQFVCSSWHRVCKDPVMWRVIDMYSPVEHYDVDLEEMCRHAVGRSQGQLDEISLVGFGDDDLLHFIASRCGKLKRLQLASCDELTGDALIDSIKRFPELEELHIIQCYFSAEDIIMVGRSCPQLRSFLLQMVRYIDRYDEYAMAIGTSMPRLVCLRLFGDGRRRFNQGCLTNIGMEAILNGCPHLESLDIHRCRPVQLREDVWERCSTQIKWYPDDEEDSSDTKSGCGCCCCCMGWCRESSISEDDSMCYYVDRFYDEFDIENFPLIGRKNKKLKKKFMKKSLGCSAFPEDRVYWDD